MNKISTHGASGAVDQIAATIVQHLSKGERVLWLVPGGSAMKVAAAALDQIKAAGVDLKRLYVTLTDERYGEPGHPDENWQQLQQQGFVLPQSVQQYRVIRGEDTAATAAAYATQITQWLQECDYAIGLFGMGADGHTAGVLPGSPAASSDKPVDFYQANEYMRVTITPQTIGKLDEIVLYACGSEKHPQLARLLREDAPVEEQPVQAIKQAGKATIFSDWDESGLA